MTTVAGFTTADIHSAIATAGVGGTVVFPAGTYDANEVFASVANQTWIFETGAKLLRSASAPPSAVIKQTHSAGFLKIRGGIIDGNRSGNTNVGNGIYTELNDCDLDVADCTIQNIAWYGIATQNCDLVLNRVTIINTKQDCVFWQTTTSRRGPQIFNCVFDRRSENPSTVTGGVIKYHGANQLRSRLMNCDLLMQYNSIDETVLFEGIGGSNTKVSGCLFSGGHTGVSVGNGATGLIVTGNQFEYQKSYGVEIGGDRPLVSSNNILGYGGTVCGIIGNGCTQGKAIGNNIVNCTYHIGLAAGGVVQDAYN